MSFQALIEDLHEAIGASRTTLRLDKPEAVFPVVAEALAPGIRSIRDDQKIDLKRAATYEFLSSEQRILVQDDCTANDPPPPKELIEFYGVRAQMLAPLIRDGQLIGIISVHYAPGPREWTEDDVAVLERTAKAAQAELDLESS